MRSIKHTSLTNIAALAKNTAQGLRGGEIFGLTGPLGSGKTAFVKALAKELRIKALVTSPTFTLLHCFSGKLKNGKQILLYHLDLYRCKNFREVKALGLTEVWGRPDTVTFIEWPDKITGHLPPKSKIIQFSHE